MFADIKTQFNVILALTVRELQGLMKNYNYGFAWALLEPIMFIGVMRGLRSRSEGAHAAGHAANDLSDRRHHTVLPLHRPAWARFTKSMATADNCCNFRASRRLTSRSHPPLHGFCIYFALLFLLLLPAVDLRRRVSRRETD